MVLTLFNHLLSGTFNRLIDSDEFAYNLEFSIIAPVHKKAEKNCIHIYRGIK